MQCKTVTYIFHFCYDVVVVYWIIKRLEFSMFIRKLGQFENV